MNAIIQIAFGTKVDSLSDPNNPIIKNAKKIFSNDISISTVLVIFIFIFLPSYGMKVSKSFGFNDWVDFFETFSLKIIKQKREELKRAKGLGKANNFLEMLLEAETENELMNLKNENDIDNNQTKKVTKCKLYTNLCSQLSVTRKK